MSYQRQSQSAGVVGTMPRRHAGAEWLDSHRHQLKNNQWVAASGQGIQAEAPTIGELMSKLSDLPVEAADLAIAYITDKVVA